MAKKEKHFKEGVLSNCKMEDCSACCCDDDLVEEWVIEYLAFHDRMHDYLESLGIKIEFVDDRVRYKNCSDGKKCKFIKHALNKEIDSRPIDCKIYPYLVDWNTIDFNKKIIKLYFWDNDCPLVREKSISSKFKKQVELIILSDFSALFHGARFKVEFMDKVLKKHRLYKFHMQLK